MEGAISRLLTYKLPWDFLLNTMISLIGVPIFLQEELR